MASFDLTSMGMIEAAIDEDAEINFHLWGRNQATATAVCALSAAMTTVFAALSVGVVLYHFGIIDEIPSPLWWQYVCLLAVVGSVWAMVHYWRIVRAAPYYVARRVKAIEDEARAEIAGQGRGDPEIEAETVVDVEQTDARAAIMSVERE